MPSAIDRPPSHRKLYFTVGYVLVAMVILAATVLLSTRRLTVPPDDFVLIVWNEGQRLLQQGSVDLAYPYPLWTPILLLPFALGSPEFGAQMWFVCSLLILSISIIFLIDLLNWPFRLSLLVILTLFVGAFGPVFTTLWIGQLNFVSVLSLVLLARTLKSESWTMAGIALGIGLLKPQLICLVGVAIFGIALWERQWRLLIAFGLVLMFLIGLSIPFAVTPRQIFGGGGASEHLVMYLAHTSTLWGFSLTIAPDSLWFPALVSCVLSGWVAYLWLHSLRTGQWRERIVYLIGVTTVVNLLILPYSWFYNQAVLILPICHAVDQLRRLKSSARMFWLVAIVVVVYFLPSAVDVTLTRIYLSEVYQVIPVIFFLPVIVGLQWQVEPKLELPAAQTRIL